MLFRSRHFWHELDTDGRQPPEDLVERLEAYHWPGNIRELRNAIAHRIALGDLAVLPGVASSPSRPPLAAAPTDDFIQTVLAEDLPLARAREQIVAEFERLYVERVLARFNGNVTRAAEASGVARRHFYSIKNRSRP